MSDLCTVLLSKIRSPFFRRAAIDGDDVSQLKEEARMGPL
jgi:hypothetical protein